LAIAYEFSRSVAVGMLDSDGRTFAVEADTAEREAVARRLDLVGLDRLAVRGHIRRGPRASVVIVQGQLEARVEQRCVVTLEPVAASVDLPFERYFLLDAPADAGEVDIGADDEEPEPVEGRALDLGEIATEELSLGLDPYPRSEEAEEALRRHGSAGDPGPDSPFDVLAQLQRRDEQD